VYVALGVTPSGERQVLGYWLLPAESALGWEGVLGELWQRGLRRVLLFITDGLPGLPEAIRRVYPQAEWQRCVVHGVRWSLGQALGGMVHAHITPCKQHCQYTYYKPTQA
jgi:putative transposase